jgi:hypothetical protein
LAGFLMPRPSLHYQGMGYPLRIFPSRPHTVSNQYPLFLAQTNDHGYHGYLWMRNSRIAIFYAVIRSILKRSTLFETHYPWPTTPSASIVNGFSVGGLPSVPHPRHRISSKCSRIFFPSTMFIPSPLTRSCPTTRIRLHL